MKRALALLLLTLTTTAGCRSAETVFCQLENCSPSISVPETTTETLAKHQMTVGEYVALGLRQNPRVVSAHHQFEAARQRIPQELSLPDPMVNTTTHLSPVQTAAGEQAFALGVSQKFVNAERRATRASIAMESVRVAQADLRKTELEISEKIRNACYRLTHIRNIIAVTRDDLKSLAQIEEIALRLYEVKKTVSQQDVLKVQIEQSKVENQLTALLQKEKSYSARLARLIHVPVSTELRVTQTNSQLGKPFDDQALIDQAIQSRPELAAFLAEMRKHRKQICLANLQNKPDFTVGLSWIATSTSGISPVANGDDAVLLGVGFNLPIRKNRIRAAIAEAKSKSAAATSRYESFKDEIAEEIFDLVAKAESTQTTLKLLREDIIPKSTRTFKLSKDEYSNGKATFIEVLENWRDLLKYRMMESQLQSEFNQTMSSLTRSIGEVNLADKKSPKLIEQAPSRIRKSDK